MSLLTILMILFGIESLAQYATHIGAPYNFLFCFIGTFLLIAGLDLRYRKRGE